MTTLQRRDASGILSALIPTDIAGHISKRFSLSDVHIPAKQMVYSDRPDVSIPAQSIPIGVGCRICPRPDCEQRTHLRITGSPRTTERDESFCFHRRARS